MKLHSNNFIGLLLLGAVLIALGACNRNNQSDAYGNFEAIETIISAQASGEIKSFTIEEGQVLDSGQLVGYIDTMQLHLQKKQLVSKIFSTASRIENIDAQIQVINAEKHGYLTEKNRLENMAKDGAATQQQLDNINSKVDVVNSRIASSQVEKKSVQNEIAVLQAQIDILDDQIAKSIIICPKKGTVLEKFVEGHELTSVGKPLFKIADLTSLELRAYISGDQLSQVKIGQKVKILIDNGKKDFAAYEGTISWVSSQSEFTPKIIQTKKERVNMVYAMKIVVPNDGTLKVGMPAEVVWSK